jgi:hypothetical protein
LMSDEEINHRPPERFGSAELFVVNLHPGKRSPDIQDRQAVKL